MNIWKIILATIVIFGAGVVTGGLLVRHIQPTAEPPRPHPALTLRPASGSLAGGLRLEFLRRAQRELELTAEQRERIDKILKTSQERTREIMAPVAPDIQAELVHTKEEFLQVLTPEQRTKFDQLVKKQQQRPHEPHHPPGPRSEHRIPTNATSQ